MSWASVGPLTECARKKRPQLLLRASLTLKIAVAGAGYNLANAMRMVKVEYGERVNGTIAHHASPAIYDRVGGIAGALPDDGPDLGSQLFHP